jgi:hypothetical protein
LGFGFGGLIGFGGLAGFGCLVGFDLGSGCFDGGALVGLVEPQI